MNHKEHDKMTDKTKERMHTALTNAAEFIRAHVECGLSPEDVNEEDVKGLLEYSKACQKVYKMLEKKAEKYKK